MKIPIMVQGVFRWAVAILFKISKDRLGAGFSNTRIAQHSLSRIYPFKICIKCAF